MCRKGTENQAYETKIIICNGEGKIVLLDKT